MKLRSHTRALPWLAAILSLTGLPARGAGPILLVFEPLAEAPAGFSLDGGITEWAKTPAQLELGPASQVAGRSRVEGGSDLTARIWLAFTSQGLMVAGSVVDDAVFWPQEEGDLLSSDHLEIWLGFPGVTMPELGFGSQWGWTDLPSPEVCAEAELGDENEQQACKSWVRQQLTNRGHYSRLFVRQFLLAPEGVTEAYWQPVRQGLAGDSWLVEATNCCSGSTSRFLRTADGYSFEALLAHESWPATHSLPVLEARMLVDLVDNDQGYLVQESFLSSAATRRFGEPESWNLAIPPRPLEPAGTPALATALLTPPADGVFVFFTQPVRHLYGLKNVSIGYQRQPEIDSPLLLRAELPTAPTARFGQVELYLTPARWSELAAGRTYWLVSVRGGKVLDHLALGEYCFDEVDSLPPSLGVGVQFLSEPASTPEAATRHFLLGCETTFHPLGSGMSGAATEMDVAALRVDLAGNLTLLGAERLDSRLGNAEVSVREVANGVEFSWEDIDCEIETGGPPPCRVEQVSWSRLRLAPASPEDNPLPIPRR